MILANQIQWEMFEQSFSALYSDEGRPGKPIRLMVSLLMLKHVRNLSDESVVEQWLENIYYQYFSGEKIYACGMPCEPSDLVHFRNRIGAEGIELIFKESIRVNGKDGGEQEATTDTTVQEKILPIRLTISYTVRSSSNVLPLLEKKTLNYAKAIGAP